MCSTVLIIFLLASRLSAIQAQILKDTSAVNLIRKGIDFIYNCRFDDAEKIRDALERLYPRHPVHHLYRGMMIYWQNFPLTPSSPARASYENELHKCIELTDNNNFPNPDYEAEYLLANLSARGLLLLFYADNGVSSEVIPLATNTYKPLRKSFSFTDECPDLYFFTGLYNYYRDAYPRVRPVYKTVAFLFPPGDMKKGIEQLELCGLKSMALKAEAYSMLAWIRMHFETDWQKSLPYCKLLFEYYPGNPNFKGMYIKNLMLLKKYDEAERIMNIDSPADTNPYYRAEQMLFNALLQEKKYRNYEEAKALYREAINAMLAYGEYGKEFQSYAYFGLSRITPKDEVKQGKRFYRRKAQELSDFSKMTFDD